MSDVSIGAIARGTDVLRCDRISPLHNLNTLTVRGHKLVTVNLRLLIQLFGLVLMLLGIYFLGKNIFFTTNVSPYFWRGVAADASIFLLCAGS
ncbi:MAG: hypothetical protein AAFZ35_18135 [Cyanobacteria bacterium J06649_12]